MTYSFRIRFNRCLTRTIETEESEIDIPTDVEGVSLRLRSSDGNALKRSEQYVLCGSGYSAKETANSEGVQYQHALMVALASSRVGVDFGFRAAKGFFTQHGLEWAEECIGVRVLNDVHGLMIYETEPPSRFVSTRATHTVGANRDTFVNNLCRTVQARLALIDREVVAFTLFNASFFQPTSDTRFILLVMAIEALIEPQARAKDTVGLVESLIKKTELSDLEQREKDSVLGSLRLLKKESIGQAGKRLAAARLGAEARYQGLSPREFFAKCYTLRSNLVHGNKPFPSFEEVGALSAPLELFVSDLLTCPYAKRDQI